MMEASTNAVRRQFLDLIDQIYPKEEVPDPLDREAIGHEDLRQTIESELLPAAEAKRQAHLAVADYFEWHEAQREMTPRKAAEWPWQLHAAGAWERLEACLTDIPLFLALYNDRMQWELTGYWHP
jgi:hypothetical protein